MFRFLLDIQLSCFPILFYKVFWILENFCADVRLLPSPVEPLKILKFNFVQLSTGKYFLQKIVIT